MVNKITFVCSNNKNRSQVAESLFSKYNKNKNWKAVSAGLFGGKYVKDKDLAIVLKKYNLKIGRPKTLNRDLLAKQNMIVIVSDDVPKEIFNWFEEKNGVKILQWNIKDGWKRKGKTRVERLDELCLDVDKKVKTLLKTLKD